MLPFSRILIPYARTVIVIVQSQRRRKLRFSRIIKNKVSSQNSADNSTGHKLAGAVVQSVEAAAASAASKVKQELHARKSKISNQGKSGSELRRDRYLRRIERLVLRDGSTPITIFFAMTVLLIFLSLYLGIAIAVAVLTAFFIAGLVVLILYAFFMQIWRAITITASLVLTNEDEPLNTFLLFMRQMVRNHFGKGFLEEFLSKQGVLLAMILAVLVGGGRAAKVFESSSYQMAVVTQSNAESKIYDVVVFMKNGQGTFVAKIDEPGYEFRPFDDGTTYRFKDRRDIDSLEVLSKLLIARLQKAL